VVKTERELADVVEVCRRGGPPACRPSAGTSRPIDQDRPGGRARSRRILTSQQDWWERPERLPARRRPRRAPAALARWRAGGARPGAGGPRDVGEAVPDARDSAFTARSTAPSPGPRSRRTRPATARSFADRLGRGRAGNGGRPQDVQAIAQRPQPSAHRGRKACSSRPRSSIP